MSSRPRPPGRSRPLRRSAALLLSAVSLAALVAAAPAPAGPDPARQDLGAELRALVDLPDGPPGAVAVLKRDGRTAVYRAGVARIGSARPPAVTDHMRIASTAKAFSGAVALSLVDRRKLALDDTLAERLPALPRAWGRVTLRQLLNHTSGLPDYTQAPAFIARFSADPRHHFDSRRLLDYVAGDPLLFRPGSHYHYSNSDNIAVALMAEAVTGRPYEELLRILVDRPLGLTATTLPQGYELPEPALHGYDVDPPAAPEDVSTLLSASGVWASGGIISTPADLTAFIRGYAGPRLIGPATRRAQFTFTDGASEPAGPGRNATGLAIFRYSTRCGVVYGHTGNIPGYTQLIAATADGRRSLTFSVSRQINAAAAPELLARLRAVQEDFVCGLLRS